MRVRRVDLEHRAFDGDLDGRSARGQDRPPTSRISFSRGERASSRQKASAPDPRVDKPFNLHELRALVDQRVR